MLYLAAISAAMMAGLVAYMVVLAMPAQSRAIRGRIADLGLDSPAQEAARAGERRERRRRLERIIGVVGERFRSTAADYGPLRERLVHAGYRQPQTVVVFIGLRIVLAAGLGLITATLALASEFSGGLFMVAVLWGVGAGWLVPGLVLASRVAARKKEITLALPDALDLLVICVEAGLGLNQALIRVAHEIRHVSGLLSEELAATTFQIRAGIPRDEALHNLADRTGVGDLKTLVNTMIQTERFGTSIARSLRVHAETLRLKRRQRAEEAAAKTTIKMIFPLALCVFPALFVVVLGPALIQIYETLSQI